MTAPSRSVVHRLADLLRRHRIDLTDEKRAQADMERVFAAAGYEVAREHRLSGADIVDFMVNGGTAVEVKIGGSRMAIYRQLERYAAHDAVTDLLLVSNVPITLPKTINGKPAVVAQLGAAWI